MHRAIPFRKRAWIISILGGVALINADAQTPTVEPDHATAYFHYTLAHMYADLGKSQRRPEYIVKAIENYKRALKADPEASYISDELNALAAWHKRPVVKLLSLPPIQPQSPR